jgi:hypothetical protein
MFLLMYKHTGGGLDVTVDIATLLEHFGMTAKGISTITFHLGLKWPQCFECSQYCSKFSSEFQYKFNMPNVYLSGITIRGRSVQNLLRAFLGNDEDERTESDTFGSLLKEFGMKLCTESLEISTLRAVLGSLSISPRLSVGLFDTGSSWKNDNVRNPFDYSTGRRVCDGLTFIECSLKRSPALTGLVSGMNWSLPKIPDFACDAGKCNVSLASNTTIHDVTQVRSHFSNCSSGCQKML